MPRWYLEQMDREMTRLELIRMRKASGLSQEKLALKLGCKPSRISGVEVGRLGVNPEDVEAWAEACGFKVSVQFLPEGQEKEIRELEVELMKLPQEKRSVVMSVIMAIKAGS